MENGNETSESHYPQKYVWYCSVCEKKDNKERTLMKTCGRCRGRQYCSAECQKKDWKAGHKLKCGKYAEGCYIYLKEWDFTLEWLTLEERKKRFEGHGWGQTYEEALENRMNDYPHEFYFLEMVDDERDNESRSCYEEEKKAKQDQKKNDENGNDESDEVDSWSDRPLIPYWKNCGYENEDDYVRNSGDFPGVCSVEELMCDLQGVPRLVAIGNDIDKKLDQIHGIWYFCGYKPGRDYNINGTSVKIGERVIMSCCSGFFYCEDRGY